MGLALPAAALKGETMAARRNITERSGSAPVWPIQACTTWIVSALTYALMSSLIVSIWFAGAMALGAVLLLALPIILLVWMVRRRAWYGAALLVIAWFGLMAGEASLAKISQRLHFMIQKPAYDHLVAQAATGTLRGQPEQHGWTRDPSSGVRYQLESAKPVRIRFRWSENSGGTDGIEYDDRLRNSSAASDRPPKLLQAEPIGDGYGYYGLIF